MATPAPRPESPRPVPPDAWDRLADALLRAAEMEADLRASDTTPQSTRPPERRTGGAGI